MTSYEARDYGIVDQVVQSRKELKPEPVANAEADVKPEGSLA